MDCKLRAKNCGGCPLLGLDYAAQLKQKEEKVRALVGKYGPVHPIRGMEQPYHYRNKVISTFATGWGGKLTSGIYAANSHKVLPVESCLLQDEVLDKTMQAVRAAANACRYQPYDEDKGTGLVRHCLLRRGVATGQVMVVLVTAQPVLPGAKNFVKALLAEAAQRGVTVTTVVQNVNSRKTSVVLGEAEKVLYGKGFILDTLCGKTYAISPRSFYQINHAQTEVLYGLAVEAAKLTGKEVVLDAYCGIGTIGLTAADHAKQVVGVELNRDAARWYYQTLQAPEGQAVRDYLDRRQIHRRIAVRFGMGAAPDSWDALLTAMTARGYSKDELIRAGLAVSGKNGHIYDKFRNRLILPVIDVRGDVVGFGSRVLDKSEPKYMNTPETLTYSKRRVLYGLNLAKKTKRPNIILCEGNLDVVTLHQAGFDNAVASMGTALTVEQTRLLSRYTKELVLCYDNDKAGALATQRALELLNRSEFTVRVLRLPNRLVDGEYVKQDADDFIKFQGPEAFERLLSGSANGIEFRLHEIAGKYDLRDDQARVAYAQEVSGVLCTLENAVEREIYTTRAAEAAGLTPEALKMEVQRAFRRMAAKEKKTRERRELNPAVSLQPQERGLRYDNLRSALAEEGVIRLLLLDDSLFGDTPPVPAESFSSPLLGRVYASLWESHMAGRPLSISSLSGELTGEEMSHLTGVVQKPESPAGGERALADYCRVIREEAQKRTAGAGTDPLAAAAEKYKNKKGYGGKHNDG